MSWHSIRNLWPEDMGKYEVKDVRHGASGTAYYDGHDWYDIKLVRGSLLLCEDIITHWKELEK